ncbi:3-methyl-2-oxobutanoate hydroxymethyltransferase [Clostridium saccharoperbutylacetonicum]|uniref:3-methyl-2-oxobutanoate hydroxymethyltransferase n=1 Tax=Clostridium saccharoperbutylacetonicum N1-4(HMT) TaxID=931276 RepID=M1MGC7_9CLOT|nr:3-methyl-2-oxobutanoate hydroxymethyltransferase [Clostridium saccharoperbutylacetonicum]AGF56974.1 3-methyl-2-oxobutanoate hydroxymethyltransferase PanB [Clostridium saccharoperbutylacetonicum N1-4(HMT)]NRT62267.1 3-methyl-2-oxobutanoate hydroxymethyltransferase [Clostridium saccharoperbutylacetonicum]NSB25603.1 3-methyl-2-oxobutanoate hydroxymethyltransferase [Clostridium saccharoperbutylacetonicum]NSB44970.1 3-methyl-2-oxobutanoate hydroxymethyltransferase [Clostridium saccharoperbutylace
MKNTVLTFKEAKEQGRKLSMLTAYDYSMAKIIDESNVNGILIGDSLGMVIKGEEDTLAVTIDEIIYHTKAVKRGTKNALIVSDMPFLSYHISVEQAVSNAGRLVKEGGANAVKLEGGANVMPQIKAIVDAQIPVMGHLGLTPQSINAFGGFKVQGKSEIAAKKLIEDAVNLEKAGVFSIVLEGIPEKVAEIITKSVSIPTIGIGAGKYCDGQILVYQDMLGMFNDFVPKFVKQYANIGEIMRNAINSYVNEVQEGLFPEIKHTFKIDENELSKLY